MDTKDYRRRIEASIAKEEQPRRARALRGGSSIAGPRATVSNRKLPAKRRAEALGQITRDEEPDAVPQLAIERLADARESAAVRLQAIKLLQQKQIFSASAAEWRPLFVEALRAASKTPAVRAAALEVLALSKDRPTQELLLQGLRRPKGAVVPAHEALRLLSSDIHSGVVDAARKVIKSPQARTNKNALVQATRILGADPKSLGTLEQILRSDAFALDARKAAATAISHLSPERLAATLAEKGPGKRRARAKTAAPVRGRSPRTGEAIKIPARRAVGFTVGKVSESAALGTAEKRRAAKTRDALAAHIATLQRVRE